MPITIQKINIAGKYRNICTNKHTKPIEIKPDVLQVNPYIRYGKLKDITKNILGAFSVEDLIKIEKIKQEYSFVDINEIRDRHTKAVEIYMKDLKSVFHIEEIKNQKGVYIYSEEKLTQDAQKNLKEKELELTALKQLILADNPKCIASYNEWGPYSSELPSPNPSKTIYEHPVDKVLRITGTYNSQDLEQIKIYTEKYKNFSIFNILEKKADITEKIQKSFEEKNADFHGQLSDKELSSLKKLAAEYQALQHLQTNYGFSSKTLESILYSDTKNLKSGEYIAGLGYITDELTVNGKDTIITFKYDDGEFLFRMYDKIMLKEKDKFLAELPEIIYLEDLNEIDKSAKILMQRESKALVSEIRFKVMEKNITRTFMRQHHLPEEFADNIMADGKYSYLIKNFKNFYKKDYPSAARVISIKLLEMLKNKNAFPIFVVAHPYDSTHSPVSMYLKASFEPLSRTSEEVQSSMSEHCEYMDKAPLIMFLQDFKKNSNLIDTLAKLYFKKA